MKSLKRVVWFCFAGCCCAGLLLVGGERLRTTGAVAEAADAVHSAGSGGNAIPTGGFCPIQFMGNFQNEYWYLCHLPNDCGTPYYIGSTTPHKVGGCTDCPDPIVNSIHPLPAALEPVAEQELTPIPDPSFSGVLR